MIRIVLFGSFYRGFYLLDELLHGPLKDQFLVTGVATDDVSQPFVSRQKRVWQYPHEKFEETMVERLARDHNVPVYTGRVKTEDFYKILEEDWRPDICIGATFGQLIDERLYSFPPFGFLNLHPCIQDKWPSQYAGPNPFAGLIQDKRGYTSVALHCVDDGFDTGELIAYSPRIAIPEGANVVDMHKITSPLIAKFAVPELIARVRNLETNSKKTRIYAELESHCEPYKGDIDTYPTLKQAK